MEELLLVIDLIVGAFGFFSGFLGVIFGITLAGYFLIRIILKILGLPSATPDQIRREIKAARFCGSLFAFAICCFVILELIVYFTGSIDYISSSTGSGSACGSGIGGFGIGSNA